MQDLSDLQSIKLKRFEANYGTLQLHESIKQVIAINQVQAQQRKNLIKVNFTPNLPESIYTDADRVIQIFQNVMT